MPNTPASQVQSHPAYAGTYFRMNGGDGDQALFQHSIILERVVAPWFNGVVGQRRNAWLMRVVSPDMGGLLFAITPRSTGLIEEDIEKQGWKSVVVSGLEGVEAGLTHYPATEVGGMSFIERL
jgi:hypothetical protein